MHTRSKHLHLLAAALLLSSGCQTYDFEPVEPIAITQTTVEVTIMARNSVPNLMLLVDTSGSMLGPMDSRQSGPDAPTRWSALQGAMDSFLSSYGTMARFGLTTYPADESGDWCTRASSVQRDLPATDEAAVLSEQASAISQYLQQFSDVSGGTPTADSLRFVGSLQSLQTDEREDFVLLLTDGLPNCNPTNPRSGPSTDCRCTLGSAQTCSGENARLGCLDELNSTAAVQELRAKGIRTIVIGFGADTASADGAAALNAMAETGGFARQCERDADCGAGDSCEQGARLCRRRYYQAGNQDELAAALAQISQRVVQNEPCLLRIDQKQLPNSEALLVVYVNGERFAAGDDTWHLKPPVGVELVGRLCRRAELSTPLEPLRIEVRAVRPR